MVKPKRTPAPVTVTEPAPAKAGGDAHTPLSARLLDLLTAAGLSQRELARRSGVDAGNISRYLSGEKADMELATARKLAAALGVPLARLTEDDAAADAAGRATDLQLLTLAQLATSPFNPRTVFDAAAIAELAESIAAQGLLQNLVVRPTPTLVRPYEIVAGERRFRAIESLWQDGRWPADRGIPCRVIAADEPTARAVALLENLQRVDISPLEEAAAFAALHALDAKRWSTAAIAGTIHRTQRYVQQRLALTRLDDRVQVALTTGQITVEAARALAPADPARQRALLPRLIENHYCQRPEWIRDELTQQGYDAALAIFPLDAYDGAKMETDDGKVWLLDCDQFMRLQTVAAQAKVAELAKEWKWARLIKPRELYGLGDYADDRTDDRAVGGALVNLRWDGSVKIDVGLVEEAAEPEDHGAAAAGEARVRDYAAQRDAEKAAEARLLDELGRTLADTTTDDLLRALILGDIDSSGGDCVPDAARGLIGLPLDGADLDGAERTAAHQAADRLLLTLGAQPLRLLAAAVALSGFGWGLRSHSFRALVAHYGLELPPHLRPADDAAAEDAEAEAPIEDVETVEG